MAVALPDDLEDCVSRALAEDVGDGDRTAGLVDPAVQARARVIAREDAVLCGAPWAEAVFTQVSPQIEVRWPLAEGARLRDGSVVLELAGPARALLTAERTALNFLQTLSATATTTAQFVAAVAGTGAAIVDTRKTVPGLRNAQKYAVRVGGGHNHRIGLYDGILIKENHIAAAGGIHQAITAARALNAGVPLMSEAETMDEVHAALAADIDLLLVDEFDADALREAVRLTRAHREDGGRTLIEYSGSARLDTVAVIAASGVDRISIGSLTKHVRAIDFSMRFQD